MTFLLFFLSGLAAGIPLSLLLARRAARHQRRHHLDLAFRDGRRSERAETAHEATYPPMRILSIDGAFQIHRPPPGSLRQPLRACDQPPPDPLTFGPFRVSKPTRLSR